MNSFICFDFHEKKKQTQVLEENVWLYPILDSFEVGKGVFGFVFTLRRRSRILKLQVTFFTVLFDLLCVHPHVREVQ